MDDLLGFISFILFLFFVFWLLEGALAFPPQPHYCQPDENCPDCSGAGMIPLDDNDEIECYCTVEWR